MPRYLFHIVGGDARQGHVRDGEGAVLRNAMEARKEAVGLAKDIAQHGLDGSTTWKVVVTDEQGDGVLTVPLSEVHTLRTRALSKLRGLVSKFFHRAPPRTLAWALIAIALVAQSVVVFTVMAPDKTAYEAASAPSLGAVVSVRFAGQATVDDVMDFLQTHRSTVIDGPRVGGFFHVRVSPTALPHDEFAQLVRRMAQEKVVDFVAAVE
jgi:Domain of unknown function (DUF6894)